MSLAAIQGAIPETSRRIEVPPAYVLRGYEQTTRTGVAAALQSPPSHGPESIENTFRRLVERWRKETAHLSTTFRKIRHPAYRAIIDMKYAALPLILKEMQREDDYWFPALTEITHEDPTKPEQSFRDGVQAWLKWAADHSYL